MYVYRFLDKNQQIIYVGKTKTTLQKRFYSHNHLPNECYLRVFSIEFIECATEADMSMKEIFYINKYHTDGQAYYNTADVSSLPQEFSFDDNWRLYTGSLPDTFANSINFQNDYQDDKEEFIIASDGRHMRLVQNSQVGVEKYVYPFSKDEIALMFEYYLRMMANAETCYREFAHFKNILLVAVGISTPFKTKEVLNLKYSDIFDEDNEVKGYSIIRDNIIYEMPFPEQLITLFYIYRDEFHLSYEKDKDKYVFVGYQGQRLSDSSIRKSLTILCKELNFTQRHSNESLRKTFFRNILDKSEDKFKAIECIEFMTGFYYHAPGRLLKYIDVIPHDENFAPQKYMRGKYILDEIKIAPNIHFKFNGRWSW